LGFCSNQPNGGMPSCPVTKPAPVALGKSSDVAKQMVAIIDQNMQKYSESYNEVKGMQSKAAVAAAASQMLYDSVASEVARLKQDMEKLQNQAVTSKAQCHSDSNSHLVASVSHERAVTTAKDVKSIDQELAVIQQLRQKLKELTAIKAVQTSNVQLDTSDSVARAISDASANMRPSTSLMLAEVIADVKNGRHFAETGEISKLLDQIVAKLNAERSQKVNDVSKTKAAVDSAANSKLNSCNAATASASRAAAATDAFNTASLKLRARTDELNAAKSEAARASKVLSDFKSNYDSESVSFSRIKEYLSSGSDSTWTTSKAALQAEIKTLKDQLSTCSARLATFEAAAKANAESENAKETASGAIEDFAAQGLAGQVLVQAICVAMQKGAGWTFAVQRPCGSSTETCAKVCSSEGQAGSLQPFNSIHMYGNQPTNKAGQPGLKTYRYNSGRDGGGCGPNYCCCGGGGAQALLELGDATSVSEFLEGAEEVPSGDNSAVAEQASIDELTNDLAGESDLEMEKLPAQSLAGVASTFEQFGAAGQILAQAACTAINPSGGYNFAIIKGCDVSTDCSTLCAQAGKSSGSPSSLQCQESLHLYQPSWNSRSTTDLKVYRYFGCGGGCGPNYCCCHGKADFKMTDLEVEDDTDVEEDDVSSSDVALNELEMQNHNNFVSSTAAQVLAESACTAINSVGGWTFAIRRTSTDKRSCQDVCSASAESQAGKLKCVDSLSIGGKNHPMVDDAARAKLGLMTYKHGNCLAMNANYCCCKNL